MKIANTEQEAWDLQEKYTKVPHGWIQYKGTDVCMDVHCKCGHMGHIDADFAYYVKCKACGTVYSCSGFIELIEMKTVTNDVLDRAILTEE